MLRYYFTNAAYDPPILWRCIDGYQQIERWDHIERAWVPALGMTADPKLLWSGAGIARISEPEADRLRAAST